MGIARAIERVKRQAKQGGFTAVMAGLGEELRNRQLPSRLRGPADRIATLLEGGRVSPSAASVASVTTPHNGHLDVAAVNTNAIAASDAARAAATSVGASTRAASGVQASSPKSPTANDSGADPGPVEPALRTPVDAEAVGATPEVNASPIEVEPVDASPVEIEVVDASPIEVEAPALDEVEGEVIAADTTPSDDQGDDVASNEGGARQVREAASTNDGNSKEELAQRGGPAKNLARSGSRGAKKRSGSKGNASKKK